MQAAVKSTGLVSAPKCESTIIGMRWRMYTPNTLLPNQRSTALLRLMRIERKIISSPNANEAGIKKMSRFA